MSDTPRRGYLRQTSEGLKPRDDLPIRPATGAPPDSQKPTTPGGLDPNATPQVPDTEAEVEDSEEKLASSMLAVVSMPDAGDRQKAVLGVLKKGSSAYPNFAKRYSVVGSKPAVKDPPGFRIYLQTGSEGLQEGGSEEAGRAFLGEVLRASGVRLRDSEYISVLLPLKDKDNPRSVSVDSASQWEFFQQTPRADAKQRPNPAPERAPRA